MCFTIKSSGQEGQVNVIENQKMKTIMTFVQCRNLCKGKCK